MTDLAWQTLQIYYYDKNKDALLLDCLRPLIASLAQRGWAERAYFTRHWEGGPHLRLHLLTEPAHFVNTVAPAITREVEAYLHQHPSRVSFTEEEARQQYELRKDMTLEPKEYVPLVPDNTVRCAPTPQSGDLSRATRQLLEEYYCDTNELAFTLLERTRGNYAARLNACFDLMVAYIAAVSPLPLARAYMSYASHVEAYLVFEPGKERAVPRRERFEQNFQAQQGAVRRRFERLLRALEQTPEQLPSWLAAMLALLSRYAERAQQGVQDGSIRLIGEDEYQQGSLSEQRLRLNASSFHAAVHASPVLQQLLKHPSMATHRVMLNLLYMYLMRIGLLNEDRYLLAYYIARICEEHFGLSSVEAIQRLQPEEAYL